MRIPLVIQLDVAMTKIKGRSVSVCDSCYVNLPEEMIFYSIDHFPGIQYTFIYFSYFITIYEFKYIDIPTKVTYRNQNNSDTDSLNPYQFNILSLNYERAVMGRSTLQGKMIAM